MPANIRTANLADVPKMVALSSAKRRAYAGALPLFWRPAADADARQTAWFSQLLPRDTTVALVAAGPTEVDGFLIGLIQPAPPVYDPGGLTCSVDDFCVREPSLWSTTGAALLVEARLRAKTKGATLVIVVCGVHDQAKRALLERPGLQPASIWFTGPA